MTRQRSALITLAAVTIAVGVACGPDGEPQRPAPPRRVPSDVPYLENCSVARTLGVATPIREGRSGYRLELDDDRDGLACETGEN